MPLHLLGKKSWNVYNPANIARVKADEEAAAAREAADEQRMQELDAERRAAILRGRTPPPLPEEVDKKDAGRKRDRDDRGRDKKRRKLAGEDDTDMDIRLAATAPKGDQEDDTKILKLRNTKIDAPLTDHAGNIDLFPIDMKEATKREKNAEVEKEKKRKERALEDQYTMRFSNAAGRDGLEQPWYAAQQTPGTEVSGDVVALEFSSIENKNVWGNEDPRRKEREIARITSSDPFAFMQQAQAQLKRSKEDKKRWAAERERELRELRATQEREDRRNRHHKRKRREEDTAERVPLRDARLGVDEAISSKHKHRHGRRSRSRSRDRSTPKSSHRHERRRSRSRSRSRDRERGRGLVSSQRALDEKEKEPRRRSSNRDRQ